MENLVVGTEKFPFLTQSIVFSCLKRVFARTNIFGRCDRGVISCHRVFVRFPGNETFRRADDIFSPAYIFHTLYYYLYNTRVILHTFAGRIRRG